uniref:Uncharacterized protein n=1 Tax=Panstrongylus lignarius TaxID=156445 RepID=A0A224Y3K6_9HEMI
MVPKWLLLQLLQVLLLCHQYLYGFLMKILFTLIILIARTSHYDLLYLCIGILKNQGYLFARLNVQQPRIIEDIRLLQ